MFDERVGEFCTTHAYLVGEENCKLFMDADDISIGFEAISTKLLKHLGQIYISKRFQ